MASSSDPPKLQLVQAAFSHLELALAHMRDQVPLFQSAERRRLCEMAECLMHFAVEQISRQDSHQESEPAIVPVESRIREPGEQKATGPLGKLGGCSDGSSHVLGPGCIDLTIPSETPLTVVPSMNSNRGDIDGSVAGSSIEAKREARRQSRISKSTISHELGNDLAATHVTPDWVRDRFLEIFDELDKDGQGSISHKELRLIFSAMGLPEYRANQIFREYDESRDGVIDRHEWLQVVEHFENSTADPALLNFLQSLQERKEKFGHVWHEERQSCCLLSHNSKFRICWDCLMVLLLAYLTITLPVSFAFGEEAIIIQDVDYALDIFFLIDVMLNFRTTYVNRLREEIFDSWKIARHYLRGWFILDLVSSVPLDKLVSSGFVPNSSAAKLLKVGKIAKALKIIRISKLVKITYTSEIYEDIEEFIWSNHCHAIGRLVNLMVQLLLCGHWFACILLAIDGPSMKLYFSGVEPDRYQAYLAAMYWSMMTMTTVGYGDVLMGSDSERAFATVAMVFGGSLYGYVIGSITALVSQHDLNKRAFKDRMDLVMSWLDFHDELPRALRRRVWRHFKDSLSRRTAMDDAVVMNDLPVALKDDIVNCLMHDDVRHNPLFEDLSPTELGKLVPCLERISVQPNEIICEKGYPGTAMYIVTSGSAVFSEGALSGKSEELCSGDSFGEEILLRLNQRYCYTICAQTKMELFRLSLEAFDEVFKDNPICVKKMEANFLGGKESESRSNIDRGRSSLLEGGVSGISPSFPDAVFEALNELLLRIEKIQGRKSGSKLSLMAHANTDDFENSRASFGFHTATLGTDTFAFKTSITV